MSNIPPIDVGAIIKVADEQYRVTNIYIDEDGDPQVTISHGTHKETVSYEDVRDQLDRGAAIRENSPHEAFEWRRQ